MKITTNYRDTVQEIVNCNTNFAYSHHSVAIQTVYHSGRKSYSVEIEAGELLKTAQQCCKKLSEISGVDFAVFREGVNGMVRSKS